MPTALDNPLQRTCPARTPKAAAHSPTTVNAVAIWREHSLEHVVGGLLESSSFSVDSIIALVEAFPGESGLVEFKAAAAFDAYPRKTKDAGGWTQQHERAKDVAALANSGGGLVVFGVTDAGTESDGAARLRPRTSTTAARDIEQYRKDVRAHLTPAVLFDMFEVPTGEGCSYIVNLVPPSAAAPHAVITGSRDKPAFVFPARAIGEAHTRYLTEFELAGMYSRRLLSAADRTRRASELWESATSTLRDRGAHGMWVLACVSPASPLDDALTVAARRDITTWRDAHPFPNGVIGAHAHSFDYPFPGPGFVEYTQLVSAHVGQRQTVEPGAVSAYLALHADGSGTAAIKIVDDTQNAGTQDVTITLDDTQDALTACVPYVLEWASHRCGSWDTVAMTTSLVDLNTETMNRFTRPVRLQGDTHSLLHGLRPALRPAARTHEIDLTETMTMQERLAHTHTAAAAQLQMFGMIEPDLLTHDGQVRSIGYDDRHRHHVQQWCAQHDVPIDTTTWPDSVRRGHS